jgi:hypothetical protein
MSFARMLVAALVWAVVAAAAVAGATADDAKATLTGEVVCSSCWFEADRTKVAYGTDADLKCAARCGKGGVPGALAVTADGKATLYLLEDGEVTVSKGDTSWTTFAGKQVEIVGTVRHDGVKTYLKVDRIRLLDPKAS